MARMDTLIDFNTCGDCRRNQQNDGHRLCQLLEEPTNQGFLLGFDQLVLAVLGKSCFRLG